MTAKLTILGSSACAPTSLGPAAGYLLEHPDGGLLIDCGPGVVGQLTSMGLLDRVTAVLVSHSHADHSADLTALAYRKSFPNVEPALPLFAPPDFPDKLQGLNEVYGIPTLPTMKEPLTGQFALRVVEPGEHVDIDGLAVETILADHPVPTLSIRIPRYGLVYTADTGYTTALEQLSSGAHLLLAEATYRAADEVDVSNHGHLDGHTVAELAAAAQVKHLLITHLAEPAHMDDVAAEAATRFSGRITMAAPRQEFELGAL